MIMIFHTCNRLLYILMFCLIGMYTVAQTTSLSGQLVNRKSEPVPYASVNILSFGTERLIIATTSDSIGAFSFSELPVDSVMIQVQSLEYGEYIVPLVDLTTIPQVNLGALMVENEQLEEAVIVAVVPFARKEVDKTVITPDALLSNAGTNALDVLGKSPGVRVTADGDISMYGRAGVLVYVDDKPTYLGGTDLANYLRGIPAESIAQIELMNNPPTRYDAAGNSGIINIRLKKLKMRGFNGSISLSAGHGINPKTSNSMQFNYRYNKINCYSSFSYSAFTHYQDLKLQRHYFNESGDLLSDFQQHSYINNFMQHLNGRLGLDYLINDRNTLGFSVNGSKQWHDNKTDNVSYTRDPTETILGKVVAEIPGEIDVNSLGANLNFLHRFKQEGRELLLNSDVNTYASNMNQQLINRIYDAADSLLDATQLDSHLPSTILIQTLKADYKQPVSEKLSFETGAKSSFIQTTNDAGFYDNENGVLTINNTFTNRFDYKERILAAYAAISKNFARTSVQLGLRYERTDISGYQYGNATQQDSAFTRAYNSLFPTLFVLQPMDSAGKHQLSFSFGRRIERPNYQDMNPFVYPLDKFTLYAGNPFLAPTFSYNTELVYAYDNRYTLGLLYSVTKNMMTETIEQNSNTFYSRPNNISDYISYCSYVQIVVSHKKWFELQAYLEANYQTFSASLYGEKLVNKGAYFYIEPVMTFRMKHNITAELTGSYISKAYSAQFITIAVWSVDATISKKILKEKGTIRLNCSDLFHTSRPGGTIIALTNSDASWNSIFDSRVVTVSFSYRFSKGQTLEIRKMNSSEEEKNRIRM